MIKSCLFIWVLLFVACQSGENQPIITELQGETLKMYEKGKELFAWSCANCHNNDMITNATGAALGGITERRTKEWLRAYVRNPYKMIQEKDPQALEVQKNAVGIMQGFPNLTDTELDQIFLYIETTYQNNKIRLHPVER